MKRTLPLIVLVGSLLVPHTIKPITHQELTLTVFQDTLEEIFVMGQKVIPYEDSTELHDQWCALESQWPLLTMEQKRISIQQLPALLKTPIIIEIGNRLLSSKINDPFTLPAKHAALSHFDACILMLMELHASPQSTLHQTLLVCVGQREIWRIQGKLNKPEFQQFLPDSFRNKLFNQSPEQVLALLKKRVRPGIQDPKRLNQ